MDRTKEELLTELACRLAGKQVEISVIHDALELICSSFSYDCGFIYEIDQSNIFQLKETYAEEKGALKDSFSLNGVFPEYRKKLGEGDVLCFCEDEVHTQHEKDLLFFFSACAITVFSITDENSRILGLVILADRKKQRRSESDSEVLNISLSLFGRYVGMRMYQNKLLFLQNSLETILDNTGIDIYVNDFYTHEILYANKSMAAPYGGLSEFIGSICWQVLFPGQEGPCEFCPQERLLDENGVSTGVYLWNYQRPFDGRWFRVFSAVFPWVDGRLAHVVSSADITENKRNEEMIRYMADYDALTGLPNRRMLISECENRINRATKDENGYILFFDIDGFKKINDQFGHDAGDEFLVQLGSFFAGIPLLKDAIYRNGGDEFVGIVGGEQITKLAITNLARFIHERFKKPWILKKGSVICNTSIGVACFPEDGVTTEVLLQKADQAMYQVKKNGGGGICFGYQIVPPAADGS